MDRRRGALPGERRGGRAKGTPNKRKSDKALVRLDEAEDEVRAIRAEGFKIGKLGKDRLAEVDEWAFRLANKFAPKENEKGEMFWESPGDEARFERYLKLSAECARARAAYESPRYAAIAVVNQNQDDDDPFEGVDPHKHLEDMLRRYWTAKEAEKAEEQKMIDVTSVKPEPDPAPIEPERGPEDGEAVPIEPERGPEDGEAVWCSGNIDDPHCKHDWGESGDRPPRAVEAVQQNSKSYLDPDKIHSPISTPTRTQLRESLFTGASSARGSAIRAVKTRRARPDTPSGLAESGKNRITRLGKVRINQTKKLRERT